MPTVAQHYCSLALNWAKTRQGSIRLCGGASEAGSSHEALHSAFRALPCGLLLMHCEGQAHPEEDPIINRDVAREEGRSQEEGRSLGGLCLICGLELGEAALAGSLDILVLVQVVGHSSQLKAQRGQFIVVGAVGGHVELLTYRFHQMLGPRDHSRARVESCVAALLANIQVN